MEMEQNNNKRRKTEEKGGKKKQEAGARHYEFVKYGDIPELVLWAENLTLFRCGSSNPDGFLVKYRCQIEQVDDESKPHLQGYIALDNPQRVTWLRNKGLEANYKKCGKDRSIYPIKVHSRVSDEYIWQWGYRAPPIKKVYKDDLSEANIKFLENIQDDNRSIHWLYDSQGGWGKTRLATYLYDNFDWLYVNGSAKDCVYAIQKYQETHHGAGPPGIYIDIPRSAADFINYSAIECLKNPINFNRKYESATIRYNVPIIIVAANFYPEKEKFSADRWKIYVIKDNGERGIENEDIIID